MDYSISQLPYRIGQLFCESSFQIFLWISFFSLMLWLWLKTPGTTSEDRTKKVNNVKARHFCNLPGPTGIPLLGNMRQIGRDPHITLAEWARQYGDLFKIRMGMNDVLVVSGLNTIKETNKSPVAFAGRPLYETSKLICSGRSLTFSDYSDAWHKHKSSVVKALAFYTTGQDPIKRSMMENSTNQHASQLIDQLLAHASDETGLVNPQPLVLLNSLNLLSTVCFGRTYELGEPMFREFATITNDFDGAMGAAQPVNWWPFLKYVPIIRRKFIALKIYSDAYWRFVSTLVKNHWDSYCPDTLRDLVDCLRYESDKACRKLLEKKAMAQVDRPGAERRSNGDVSNMDAANGLDKNANNLSNAQVESHAEELEMKIATATGDVFGAGYDTLHTAVTWMILYMAAYPEMQQKVRDEIERVVSQDEQPSFRLHGPLAPYTQAWIYEMLRHTSLVPLLVPHATTKATELRGYLIPAGTTVFFNCWQTTRDPEVWENPEDFRPERFLETTEGSSGYALRANCTSKLLSWGLGIRKCLGQQLSRHQLFIYASTIVRRCYVEPAEAGVEPKIPWSSETGLTIKPCPFNVRIRAR